MKLKELLKKSTALLISVLMILTSAPISSVYASSMGSSAVNIRTTTAGGGAVTSGGVKAEKNIGNIWEVITGYIWNKSTGEFIQGTYNDKTYDVIDFFKSGIAYNNAVSDRDDGSLTEHRDVAVGTYTTSLFVDEYPFRDNSTGEKSEFVDIGNGKSETHVIEINDWLNTDNASNLNKIVNKYWGEDVLNRLKRDNNLMIIFEESELVTQLDEENGVHSKTIQMPAIKEWRDYAYVTRDEELAGQCQCGEGCFKVEDIPGAYSQMEEDLGEDYVQQILDDFNPNLGSVPDGGLSHFEVRYNSEETTIPETHYYNFQIGTARFFNDNEDGGETHTFFGDDWYVDKLGVPSYFEIDWLLKGCYTDYIGTADNNYNGDYPFVFAEGRRDDSGKYAWFMADTTSNGVNTTAGLLMFAPGSGSVQWHTNNPKSSEPSHADDCSSSSDRINFSHAGGNKQLLKIYETIDSNTGKTVKIQSYHDTGIPCIMEIDDESKDSSLDIECSEHAGEECRRSWFKWMESHESEGYSFSSDHRTLYTKGSGFTTSDWCTIGNIDGTLAYNIAIWFSNNSYKTTVAAYENFDGKKSNVGVGNKHYVSLNDDDTILIVRYIKYINGDDVVPNLFDYDSVLSESQLTSVAKLDSTINDIRLGSKMFQANSLSGDDLVDDSLSLGIGVNLHNESKYLDSILGYESVQHSATRPNTNLYKKSVGGNGVSIGITRRQSDATGSNIVGISDVSVTTISKDGKTVVNEKGSDMVTSAINGLFGTTRGNVTTVETPSDNTLNIVSSNLGTSADMNTEIIDNVTLESGSLDPWTSDTDGNVSIADLTSDADKTTIKDGVQYRTADSSINVSSIKKNESGINGSMQSNTVMMGIQPLIKMGYTSLENNSYKTGNTLVTTNNIREIAVNSYAGITYLGSIDILVESNTWAIDNILTNGDKAWNKPGQVLKGGSIVTLGTAGKSNTINIYSAQLVNDGSDYSNSGLVSYSESCDIDTVKSYHEEYKDSVIDNLKQTYLTQWLSNNVSNTSTPAYEDSGAVKVSGLENDDFYNTSNGYSNTNPFNSNGLELQPDSKYWLNSGNSNTADSGRFDITQEKTTYKYYKFITNYDGRVYMLTSNEPEFKNPTVSLLLESNQGYSDLKNDEALRIDQQTNILQNMLNTAIRHQGNDSGNENWSSLNDGRWYNEVLSATVLVQNTAVDIGINMPNKRMHVIDTSLEPYSKSRLDQGTTALKTCWTTNWSNLQKLGTFRNVPISLDKAMQMFKSRNTYITNMSVQDNL